MRKHIVHFCLGLKRPGYKTPADCTTLSLSVMNKVYTAKHAVFSGFCTSSSFLWSLFSQRSTWTTVSHPSLYIYVTLAVSLSII